MATYRNNLYSADRPENGPQFFRTRATPHIYRGIALFNRDSGWDLVDRRGTVTRRPTLTAAQATADFYVDTGAIGETSRFMQGAFE